MSGRNHGRIRREKRRDEPFFLRAWLRSVLSLKARGRFSEATGAGGIRVELDYTAKGYIYRARMYAEARTSPQRGRPCGFSLDATSRVDSWFRTRRLRVGANVMDCPTFLLAGSAALSFFAAFLPSLIPPFLPSFLIPLRKISLSLSRKLIYA